MMPFVRLLAIYALVGAAIFAFLKRDQLIAYYTTPEAEQAAASAAFSPEAEPAQTPDATANAEATGPEESIEPSYSAPPVYGSQITPQYFGQAAAPTATPAPAAPSSDGLVARWTKAREVFSQGNTTEAARLYEALTSDFPNNADLHGETGNLYYNLGQFGKAATHFLAVGKLASREGNMQMAQGMATLLMRIAPNKATELQSFMRANR